jgi:hypothetical protein
VHGRHVKRRLNQVPCAIYYVLEGRGAAQKKVDSPPGPRCIY